MKEAFEICPWAEKWLKEIAIKASSFMAINVDDRHQEAVLCFLSNQVKIQEIEAEQGLNQAQAYLGRIVNNRFINLNAITLAGLTGIGGGSRKADSKEVKANKWSAMYGGISLDSPVGDDGTLGELIPSKERDLAKELDLKKFFELCPLFEPLLLGKVDNPIEWCEKFPQAGTMLVETKALRHMAVYQEALKAASIGLNPIELTNTILNFLEGWRGVRGDYGDLDEGSSNAEFKPSTELADLFPEGSSFKAIALGKDLSDIPGFQLGFSESLLCLVEKEALAVAKANDASEPVLFKDVVVNRARSYLKAKGGLIKFSAVALAQQQNLFDYD